MRNIRRLSIILTILANFCLCSDVLANKKDSSEDKSYKQVFEYIQNKNWQDAEHLAKKISDKILFKIVLSQEFLDSNYKNTDFKKIVNFLKQNPKWPQNGLLKTRAEGLINENFDKTEIYHWFSKNPPITGCGYKYYALAASQILTDVNQLTPIIKDGWIYGSFNKDEQIDFYRRFKKFLSKDDIIKRVDNLIWKGSTTLAKSLFNLVDAGYTKAFEAQIAFSDNKKDAKKLFRTVPKEYYTSGLVYHYINSIKSELPESNEIVNLVNSVKRYQFHENDFLKVQTYLAREYIENKRYKDAYQIASNHFATSDDNVRDIEFLSGWLALRFLNEPDLAIEHFKKFNQVVKPPISVSRGLYWLGRAYAQSGKKEEARKLYEQTAHRFGYTFYGQVASMEIGATKLRLPPKVVANHSKNDDVIKNSENLKAADLVSKYAGSSGLVKIYLEGLVDATDEEDVLAIVLATKTSKPHHKVWLSRRALQKHVFIDHYSYPDPYKINHLPTEKSLVYSIVRQESGFEQAVIAPDKGMGLMQLMEPTACDTAKKLEIKCRVKSLTQDPHYNLTLGSNYLAEMLKKHQNSYVLAIAAYNAGPHRVKKWLNLYGDMRKFKDYHEVIDWIESIPFPATRNYVQRVLENVQVYRAILNKDGKFKLRQDLLAAK